MNIVYNIREAHRICTYLAFVIIRPLTFNRRSSQQNQSTLLLTSAPI